MTDQNRTVLRDAGSVAAAASGARQAFLHMPMSLDGPDGAPAERDAAKALRAAGVEHLVVNTGMALPEESVGDPLLDGRVASANELMADGPTALVPTVSGVRSTGPCGSRRSAGASTGT